MDGGLPRFGSTMTMSQNMIKESTRHSGFETTPSLPPIRITQKISGSTLLPSILNEAAELTKASDDENARVKISYIARNAALNLIQKYKTLVSVKSIAATEIPSTTTKSSGNAQGSKVPKRFDKNGRRGYVFTEGISSISKRQLPSFSMPTDKVLRANLPSDIVVDKQGNQYALSVNQKRDKISRKLQESPKFRQMKMFGLDNLPLIDLGRYTAAAKTTEGHKVVTKSKTSKTETKPKISQGKLMKNPAAISNNFGSSPAKKNGHGAFTSTASSGDTETPATQRTVSKKGSTNLKRRQRPLTRHLAGNATDSKVLSVAPRVNPSNYISSKRYFSSNVQPTDWQYRVNEPYRKSSMDRNPSLNGMYSLAPIRFGSQAPPMNFDSDVPKRYSKRTYEARKHAQTENTENDMYVYFEADTSRSVSSQRRRRSNRSRTSANSSSTMTSHTLQNPPPSFVSTGSDDMPSLQRFNESVRGMLPVHEENCNDTQISHSPTEKYVPTSLQPPPLQNNQNVPENTENDESHQSTKTEKGTIIGNIVTLGNDLSTNIVKSTGQVSPKFSAAGFTSSALLSVPMVSIEKERFPPMKQTEYSNAEVDSLPIRDSPSKLKVQTLRLFTDNKQEDANGVSSSQFSATETPLISVTSHFGVNETIHDGKEESGESFSIYLQKMSISQKTMEFVSPLEVQANAKRQ